MAGSILARGGGGFSRSPARRHDLQGLRARGFSDDDIWDIGSITALFALSNRIAHLSAMRPNDEFYLMGRVPKEP